VTVKYLSEKGAKGNIKRATAPRQKSLKNIEVRVGS